MNFEDVIYGLPSPAPVKDSDPKGSFLILINDISM